MELPGRFVLVGLALAGHIGLWLGLANRLHGLGLSRWTIKAGTWLMRLILVALPLLQARSGEIGPAWLDGSLTARQPLDSKDLATIGYAGFCIVVGVVYLPQWLHDRLRRRPTFLTSRRQLVSMVERLGARPVAGLGPTLLSRLPGNQLLSLEVVEHSLEIARLPARLDGLSLVHLSDLHFSGRVTPAYFHEAMRLVKAWEPDLILLTGDVCEKSKFIPWIAEILAPVHGRLGKFFVLGNHDVRTRNVPGVRQALAGAGFTDLNGRWHELRVDDARIVLGGDERPWLGSPLDPRRAPPRSETGHELRLVLLHTPDRLGVARAADADLVLAGHTHGGQIRLPGIGAIVCPSLHGMRYDAGLFLCPPAKMFVSRGLSAYTPIRFNCLPELTRLVLRLPQSTAARSADAGV